MYTSYIGKKFLQLYREKEKKPDDYSARQFFDEVLFPLFFDDPITLMWVHNSPFDQLNKEDSKKRKEHLRKKTSESYFSLKEDPLARLSKKDELYKKITAKEISGSTAVGFYVADVKGNTSGQITTLPVSYSDDDILSSWIGQSLSIGLKGGYMLIDNSRILNILSEGWQYYREFVSKTSNLKGNQIETWNAHWLSHRMSKLFDSNTPLRGVKFDFQGDEKGVMSIPTMVWSNVVFNLSLNFPQQTITCYAYFLGKTNDTLGFINIYLPEVRRPFEWRDKVFLNQSELILKDKQIENLETFYKFGNACKMGTIGLKALEPAKLREFMPSGSVQYAQGKNYKFTDDNSKINFSLYKLWIIAMLNKTELLQLAADVANALIALERKNERGKTTQTQSSKELLEVKSLKSFIDGLTENISEGNATTFKNVVEQLVKMPSDNFPLFVTLIRFEYAYQKHHSSTTN